MRINPLYTQIIYFTKYLKEKIEFFDEILAKAM